MAAWRRAIELALGEGDTAKLRSIAQSRTEPASRVERARILLAYREDPSFFAVGRALGLHHQTVQRAVSNAPWWKADGRARRSPASWSRAFDHTRSQGVAGVAGVHAARPAGRERVPERERPPRVQLQ
jgi:hypothetical protein